MISDSRAYWKELHSVPSLQENLDEEIRASWKRSIDYGVSPHLLSPPMCSQADLEAQPNLEYMLDVARPMAHSILKYLSDEYAVLLFGQHALLRSIIAKEHALKRLNRFGVVQGALFSEDKSGTNAASLGEILGKPVQVVGFENFCRFCIDYGTSYAPIIDRKKVIGGIGIVGPVTDYDRKLLALADTIAHGIAGRVGVQRWSHLIDRSINEGVLAVHEDETIFWMSEQCHRILNYPVQNTYGHRLDSIIDPTKPENHYFWNIIKKDYTVTDEAITLMVGKDITKCIVTINHFKSTDQVMSVKLIVFQGIERINKLIRNFSGNTARLTFKDVIGSNPRFLNTVNHARRSAGTISNIVLLGESGTGKDVLAQAIHNESPRRSGPFVALNCAALPRELIASELFGYEEGAFTGAKKGGNIGKFELAHQGTIFLDEIGDMPLDLQASLLRVIEEKSIVRLGGNKQIPVNVRIIAATNKDLEFEVEKNNFRRDLYYRLRVINLHIPPLRERYDDIPVLSQHFLNILCRRLNLPKKSLAPDVIFLFQHYSWPGNVRELQNVLESAVQWTSGTVITKDQFESLLPSLTAPPPTAPQSNPEVIDKPSEKQIIESLLEKYDNNKSKTAKALGVSRKTLYKRLSEYGLI